MRHSSQEKSKAFYLTLREIRFRPGNFVLSFVSVLAAVSALVVVSVFLGSHEEQIRQELTLRQTQTSQLLSESDDVVKRAMSRLGFNIVLLSSGQELGDWYREEYAQVTIPESTAEALKAASLETVERIVPVLRRRLEWKEQDRTVIVLGVGEEARAIPEDEQASFLRPVERGSVHLGYSLHSGLGLQPGDTVQIEGRSFRVDQNNPSRGSVDDLTVYMHLADAQALLDQPDSINEILALQTPKAWSDVEAVRREITNEFPGLQIIEYSEKAIMNARARYHTLDARAKRFEIEQTKRLKTMQATRLLAWGVLGLVILIASVWLALLSLGNVGERQGEIGILSALGYPRSRVVAVFLWRAVILAIGGAVGGTIIGALAAGLTGASILMALQPAVFLNALLLAVLICGLAAVVSVYRVLRLDPAAILCEI